MNKDKVIVVVKVLDAVTTLIRLIADRIDKRRQLKKEKTDGL